jgi:hypothetical protein
MRRSRVNAAEIAREGSRGDKMEFILKSIIRRLNENRILPFKDVLKAQYRTKQVWYVSGFYDSKDEGFKGLNKSDEIWIEWRRARENFSETKFNKLKQMLKDNVYILQKYTLEADDINKLKAIIEYLISNDDKGGKENWLKSLPSPTPVSDSSQDWMNKRDDNGNLAIGR